MFLEPISRLNSGFLTLLRGRTRRCTSLYKVFVRIKMTNSFKDGEVFGWESRLKNSGYDTIRTFLPEQQNEIINFWYGKRGQI